MIEIEVAKIKGFVHFLTRFLKKNWISMQIFLLSAITIPKSGESHGINRTWALELGT
jgi:hypothetical protein